MRPYGYTIAKDPEGIIVTLIIHYQFSIQHAKRYDSYESYLFRYPDKGLFVLIFVSAGAFASFMRQYQLVVGGIERYAVALLDLALEGIPRQQDPRRPRW